MEQGSKDKETRTDGLQPTVATHPNDIADIIGTPPGGLIRWGITWVFILLLGIVALAGFIRYPDIVRAPVRINAANAPKAVISRVSGNMTDILVKDGDTASMGQPLAWMESTADHAQVLQLLGQLLKLRDSGGSQTLNVQSTTTNDQLPMAIGVPANLRLGELQGSYQSFYQSYLTYLAATGEGIYLKQQSYILKDLRNVDRQRDHLEKQQHLQQQEYALAETGFNRYQVLMEKKMISPAEYQQAQANLLASRHPLQQTESALLANEASRMAKTKELADLNNQIAEEKSKFMQALGSLISEIEQWKLQHVPTAPQAGTVVYAGIIQRGQHIEIGQELFHINPGSTDFFGEMNVPQYNMGKVREGQQVLIKLNSYPFEQYGTLEGRVDRLSRVPYRDSIFLSKVDLDTIASARDIHLTTGMLGTAEIITEDASLLQRLVRNIKLVLNERN